MRVSRGSQSPCGMWRVNRRSRNIAQELQLSGQNHCNNCRVRTNCWVSTSHEYHCNVLGRGTWCVSDRGSRKSSGLLISQKQEREHTHITNESLGKAVNLGSSVRTQSQHPKTWRQKQRRATVKKLSWGKDNTPTVCCLVESERWLLWRWAVCWCHVMSENQRDVRLVCRDRQTPPCN